jgi:hypothetical protein
VVAAFSHKKNLTSAQALQFTASEPLNFPTERSWLTMKLLDEITRVLSQNSEPMDYEQIAVELAEKRL